MENKQVKEILELNQVRNNQVIDSNISLPILGKLINIAGRQRMLSQKIGLQVLMSLGKYQVSTSIFQEAINLFKSSHLLLTRGKGEFPGAFSAALQLLYFNEPDAADFIINQFIKSSESILKRIEEKKEIHSNELNEYLNNLGPLLVLLNKITIQYEEEAKLLSQKIEEKAKKERDYLISLLENIGEVSQQTKMISFNAHVIAARSGAPGKEFSIVAQQVQKLSTEIDKMIAEALKTASQEANN